MRETCETIGVRKVGETIQDRQVMGFLKMQEVFVVRWEGSHGIIWELVQTKLAWSSGGRKHPLTYDAGEPLGTWYGHRSPWEGWLPHCRVLHDISIQVLALISVWISMWNKLWRGSFQNKKPQNKCPERWVICCWPCPTWIWKIHLRWPL